MGKKISEIEGIGPAFSEKLAAAGINTVEQLLEKGGSKAGRAAIVKETGLDAKRVLSWVNMADLFRIKGVAGEWAELLEAAGVDTVKELRTRNAANLHAKMLEVNEEKNLCRVCPAASQVEDWVKQAKDLDPAVTH